MATHSNILAWKIPWTEEPGKLQFTGSKRLGHNLATKQQCSVFYAHRECELETAFRISLGRSIGDKGDWATMERKHDDKWQCHAGYELSGSEGKRMMRKEGPRLEMLKAQLLL